MPSNGKFLAVLQPIRLENTGYEIRVRDYSDLTTLVAVVSDWVDLTFSVELNGSGQGSVTLNLDTEFFTQTLLDNTTSTQALLEYEYLWEAWENGTLRAQWLGRQVDEQRVQESETRTVTVSGPGPADLLKDAKIMRPGFPKPVPKSVVQNPSFSSSSDSSPAYKWIFPPKWPVMRMWWTLFKSAQKRGVATNIKPTFTATTDSAGGKWQYVPTSLTIVNHGFTPTNGQSLYDFLSDCTGQDYTVKPFAEYVEWAMWPGFKLDVRPVIGAHREKKVVFFEGGTIYDKQRVRSREDIGNVVIVVDNENKDSFVTDTASVKRWKRREYYYDQAEGTATDATRRVAIGHNLLKQHKDETSEWTITVPAFDQYRRPFYDYNIGDWIGISTWHSFSGNQVDAYRIQAISISVEDETPTVELTLQDKLAYEQAQLQKELTLIIYKLAKTPATTDQDTPDTDAGNATFDKEGYADGIRVFVQDSDPGTLARPGDFWFDTTYQTGTSYPYMLSPNVSSTYWFGNNNGLSDITLDVTPSDEGNMNPLVRNGGTPKNYAPGYTWDPDSNTAHQPVWSDVDTTD